MALAVCDAEPLDDDALKIEPAPAHDAVRLPIEPGLNDSSAFCSVDRRGVGPSAQWSFSPSGPAALKR